MSTLTCGVWVVWVAGTPVCSCFLVAWCPPIVSSTFSSVMGPRGVLCYVVHTHLLCRVVAIRIDSGGVHDTTLSYLGIEKSRLERSHQRSKRTASLLRMRRHTAHLAADEAPASDVCQASLVRPLPTLRLWHDAGVSFVFAHAEMGVCRKSLSCGL